MKKRNNVKVKNKTFEKLRSQISSAFMNYSPAFMYIKDSALKHIYANKSLLEQFNVTLDEFIGTTSYDFMPDDLAKKIEAYDSQVMQKGIPIETDEISFTQKGKLFHFKEIKFPVALDSGDIGVGGIVMDITSLKEKEAHIQKAYDEIKQLKDQIEQENIYLRQEIGMENVFKEITGQSDALRYVLYRVEQVASTDTTVLILGETGTGKELVARAIHERSNRTDRPLVTVNCAALPANLIESELFGRAKGAFTGAHEKQIGRFELADKGTIFLDEIGELPLELQTKLLRVLQEGTFERLGSPHTIKVDVRVIASTNRDLREAMQKGNFREDLYYRLDVFPITIPPLRMRKDDIPLLVHTFMNKFSRKLGKRINKVPNASLKALQEYSWPGNVRELQHVIERAVIISPGTALCLTDALETPSAGDSPSDNTRRLKEREREHIFRILQETNWKIEGEKGAARILDINPNTLRYRMNKLGIYRPQ
jgi:PAS domain S-box-containing protein